MSKSNYELFKDYVEDFTPPILWRNLVSLKLWLENAWIGGSLKAEWEFIAEGWSYEEKILVRGWDEKNILKVYQNKWNKFVELVKSPTPLAIAHESDLTDNESVGFQNTILAFAYSLALAAHKKDELSFLDWGGGIGHYNLFAQMLLPKIEINYHCKDLPILAAYGTELFPTAQFYVDESCLENSFDFVMASGSLHYEKDWASLLDKLTKASKKYLFITRLPMILSKPSFIFIQRPYRQGYNTEYLGWCLNRSEFLAKTQEFQLKLVREFIIDERPNIAKAPEQCKYRGFLFQTKA
ncbi:MAG: hypothetical protein WAQ98_31810 [Blastocatellia bacterium]